MPTIERVMSDANGNEEVWVPYADGDEYYTLARPNAGPLRNLAENEVKTRSLEETAHLISLGYSLRMWRGYGERNLISPKSITVTW